MAAVPAGWRRQHHAVEYGQRPMTRLLTAATLIASLTVPAVATTESCAIVRKTPDGFLNMRYQPKMGAVIVGR
jgi:hypothetical protein